MSAMSRNLPLAQALPCMVLGDDVILDGHLLLPAGTVLSAAQIESLRRREVDEIVVATPDERSEEMREAELGLLRRRVEYLFRRAAPDAAMQALQKAVLEYRLESAG